MRPGDGLSPGPVVMQSLDKNGGGGRKRDKDKDRSFKERQKRLSSNMVTSVVNYVGADDETRNGQTDLHSFHKCMINVDKSSI